MRRTPCGSSAAALFGTTLAVYVSVLLAGAFLHHDAACHATSRSHCTTCHLSASASGIERPTSDGGLAPAATDRPIAARPSSIGAAFVHQANDRSPPV